jgi:uncharacterized protein YkwD
MKKIILFLFFILLLSCTTKDERVDYVIYSYPFNQTELSVMQITNEHRVSIGLNTLVPVQHFGYLCYQHNQYMIEKNVVNHDYFIERSTNITNTYHASSVGEVIAYNYTTPTSALQAWLNSPEHKQVIEGKFTHFGVSVSEDSNNHKYYTFIFAKI